MTDSALPASRLMLRIAATLAALASDAADFGLTVCRDRDIAASHLERLQQIDRLAQSLRALGRVLSADDPREAVNEICLDDLRSELMQAL
jgi:hypothetical protein